MTFKRLRSALALALLSAAATSASAGSIFLTGHDVDLHDNQNGFSTVILDYLRGAGTPSEIARPAYRVGFLTGNSGVADNPPGFTVDRRTVSSFADASAFGAWLSGLNALEVASHVSCGGCSLTDADSARLNSWAPQVTSFFNAGGDIWANTSGTSGTYYGFLPPSAAASGPAISGSSGFTATPEGVAIGILPDMINGFQTHNRFTSFTSSFTVFETRGSEIISIGLRDARIEDGGITIPGGGTTPPVVTPPTGSVPTAPVSALLAVGMAAAVLSNRRRRP